MNFGHLTPSLRARSREHVADLPLQATAAQDRRLVSFEPKIFSNQPGSRMKSRVPRDNHVHASAFA